MLLCCMRSPLLLYVRELCHSLLINQHAKTKQNKEEEKTNSKTKLNEVEKN